MKYIHVKATAEARKETLKEKSKDHFEISVRERAERNMANARILKLMAEHFEVPVSKVRIINGHRHSSKLLIVEE